MLCHFVPESFLAMRKIIRSHEKLRLYFGTVKSGTGGRHFMAWANSREHALDLVEAALTATEPVQGMLP
jgi:putative IMPACT (imprinted ancient) family translation regulator